jgi:hypothetical protein
VVAAPEVKAPPPAEKPDQDTVTRVEVEHTVTDRVEVEMVEKEPEPEKELEPEKDPELPGWLGLSTHAQLDRHLTERRIDQPDNWASMTVARKKAWLEEYPG